MGISQGTISNWKNRGNNPNSTTLKKLADYFGVSMEYMLGGKMEWNPETQEIIQTDEYYLEDDAKEYAQFLFANPNHRVLFDASRKVKAEDLNKALKAIGLFIDED